MKLRLLSNTLRGALLFLLFLMTAALAQGQSITVRGRVIDGQGQPVAGATVIEKGTSNGAITDEKGGFVLHASNENDSLVITSIGYERQAFKPSGSRGVTVTLNKSSNELDQTVIRAYGTTTRRLNTGDISTVTAKEIAQQPVSNPLAALEGRVPGLVVTQSSGVPGSAFKVQIMGQNSIAQGSEPLFVIDGIPYGPNNDFTNQLSSAAVANDRSGLSPFSSINPSDIESVEILKDADATAIYGSRGANGVVLITTKRGRPGKARFTVNIYSGMGKVSRTMNIMNTAQYLNMRREAFKNDNVIPNESNAPDLLSWDTTRYTDLQKILIGGTAASTNAQATLSGGNSNTQFLISGGYNRQTTVFPGNMADHRSSLHFNLNHQSDNKKFSLDLSAGYASEKNDITTKDLTTYTTLPPDLPPLYDSVGKLNWEEGGQPFDNPLAYLAERYVARTDNTLGNLRLSYNLIQGLKVKVNMGYNTYHLNEVSLVPTSALNPFYSSGNSFSSFGDNDYKSWSIEPQAEYVKDVGKGKLDILIGGSWQQIINKNALTNASGFANDALIQSITAASSITASSGSSEYRYEAVFGRINYNWQGKYLINLSGRRDGSSRFGPARQFATFGAIGAGWIFIDENSKRPLLPFMSFGKLRVSYGSTGNDQISDYAYLNDWKPGSHAYDGVSTLYPATLFNPDYGWEINRKFETALDLAAFNDRLSLTTTYFRNRCGNQLVSYTLPAQTGFPSILENFPALVQNTGWEFSLTSKNMNGRSFSWTTSINLTIPHNKLVSFPGLENTSYSYLVVGQSLSVLSGFHYLGVDPQSGIYEFEDAKGKPTTTPSRTDDRKKNLGNLDPKFYGGLGNHLQYKSWGLDLFFVFRKQVGRNYLYNSVFPAGTMQNQPALLVNRWQNPGDVAKAEMYTTTYGSAAYSSYANNLATSDAVYTDAAFIRLKNVSLSYTLPEKWMHHHGIQSCNLYLHGQNLLLITNYKGSDPETQSFYSLPPLRTIVFGIQITL